MNKLLSILIGVGVLFSCTEQFEPPVVATTPTENYVIPIKTALNNLDNYLRQEIEEMTKSGTIKEIREIENIQTVFSSSLGTKSVSTNSEEELLYLVNFKKKNGYAILSADKRIPAEIIAVTDRGSITWQRYDLSPKENTNPSNDSGIIEDEDGYYYINPDTFQLYDKDIDDYLVGNYISHEVSTKSIAKDLRADDNSAFILDLCVNFAIEETRKSDFSIQVDKRFENRTLVIEKSDPKYITVVDKLIQKLNHWSQDDGYNQYCKNVKNRDTKQIMKAYTGCVPLALAKIITTLNYPKEISHKDLRIKYDRPNGTEADTSQAAALMWFIGKKCGSLYFSGGTFTFPKKAKNFLTKEGYKNVEYKKYETNKVLTCLDNGCPVAIFAIPRDNNGYDLKSSHGWIIDGYLNRKIVVTYKEYVEDVLEKVSQYDENLIMVHCDFGWGGNCNGYFVSGIFNMADSSVVYDAPQNSHKTTNYNRFLKTITYDNPNK